MAKVKEECKEKNDSWVVRTLKCHMDDAFDLLKKLVKTGIDESAKDKEEKDSLEEEC